jgi:hypothetical protein
MSELTVTLASHYFKVHQISARARVAVEQFARKYILFGSVWENGRYVRAPLKVFAASTADRSEYRFHINTLEEFKTHLTALELKDDVIDYKKIGMIEPVKVDLRIYDHWVVRPDQIPAVEYLVTDEAPVSKLLALGTGVGKSFTTMKAVSTIGYLSAWIMQPKYIDKTIRDFRRTYDLELEDLMVIRGSAQLQQLLFLANEGEIPSKIILISSKTIQNWIKLYEKLGAGILDIGYACIPEEFFALLGVGVRVIDEVHQEFHLNFKIDLYSHVKKSISLSATLQGDDGFINRMYDVAYPIGTRYQGAAAVKYISATSVMYRFKDPDRIRTSEWKQKTYSHHVFEASIVKDKQVLNNYIRLIETVIQNELVYDRKAGEKMLVYVAGVEFATQLVNELRKLHPSLVVSRYCGSAGDPYENLMDSDLTVTTLGSAGTNVDIENLKCVLLTPAVLSSQANVQGFGRLRNNLPDGRVPRFIWLVNQDKQKHIDYHLRKMSILENRALSLNSQNYPHLL